MRPPLIDTADGPCEICPTLHKFNPKGPGTLCDACHDPIPEYPNMGLAGYRSAAPSHMHLTKVLGVIGKRALFTTLCRECYIKDYQEVYGQDPGI